MEQSHTKDVIGHQRWLINNGFANDMLNDNLYLFGIYLHPGICEALVSINMHEKSVTYKIYVTNSLLKDFNKYKQLLSSTGKLNAIRLKRLWRKHFDNKQDPARLDIDVIINSHVKELCGSNWSTSVSLLPEHRYAEDTASLQDEIKSQENSGKNKQPDQ